MKNLKTKIRAYALKNAVAYKGKAQKGAIISALFNEGLKEGEIKKYSREIDKIIMEVNKLSTEKQKADFEKLGKAVSRRKTREGLPELPNVGGKVRMRFAPSASGPMHVGHAMTACISFLLAQKYKGIFYVRIEDTNPDNIYPGAYKMIKEESDWLFKNRARIIIQSERMKLYYKYAEKLINKKAAYVCICNPEKFRELASQKKECPCRGIEAKDNLKRWKKMLSSESGKNYKEGGAVLRFKTPKSLGGIEHPNPAMRDFPLARINIKKHPLQGKKYRVWPLMNLSVAVDDLELKMTHIIRAKDHRDNAKRQEMIYKVLNLEKEIPWNGFLGRFKFKDMELSTTKMKKEIKERKYKGWDDPRLPTLESLKKKGYKPEAFWKFAERIGFSESDKVIDKKEYFRLLDYFNRNI